MSTHSQFKKFNILQELEQAIKKKTQEKYNPNRSKSRTKPSQNIIKPVPIKSPGADKQHSIAPQSRKVTNQATKPSKIPEFKIKKHQNKKFDKIVSLINYTITSADKALKYVTLSSNFEAEFAFKLYLSDRQNLMSQLNNFNLAEIAGQPTNISYTNAIEMKGFKNQSQSAFIESNVLRQENDKLKKEIMVLQNQLKRSQKSQFHESKSINSPLLMHEAGSSTMIKSRQQVLKRQNDFKQRQIQRISDLLKRVCESSEVYDFLQLLQKDTKYRYILASISNTGYEVTSKQKQEIEQNIAITQKKLSQIQKDVVRKMNELMQPPVPSANEELVKQYNRLKQMIEKKLVPTLDIKSEEAKFSNLSDALTTFITNNSKKEREYKMQAQKFEFELNQIRKRKDEFEQRQLNNQSTISKLNKDNQLVRSNLRQIYQQLLSLAFPDQNDSEKTFQQILDHLTDTLQAHQTLLKESQNVIKENTLLKQQMQSYRSQVSFLKQQNQSIKSEINKKGYTDQAQVQKYTHIISNMQEQINNIKHTNNNLQDQKMQIEELLKNSDLFKRELQEQNMKVKSEVNKLRKQLTTRMQEMREYAGVCSKLEQNYTLTLQENEKMSNQLADRKDQLQTMRHENVNMLDHMRELQEKLKYYENQLNHREEVYQNQDRMRVEFNRLNNSYDQISQAKRQLQSQFKYGKLRIEELQRQLKTINATLMKKQELNIQLQMKYQHKLRQAQSKLQGISSQNENYKQAVINFQEQRRQFQIQKQELIQHYQNIVSYKNKQIDQLNGSKKQIEVLNIKQQYITQYNQRSMNDLGSQNELNQLNSPQSSNEQCSPKSVYEKGQQEVQKKQKLQQLDEINQISQIKPSELNQIKELLEQKTIQHDSLIENYRQLQQHYQEKVHCLQVVNQKYQQYEEKINNLLDQLHLKDGELQHLVQEIQNLTQQLTQTRMRSSNSYVSIETLLKNVQFENASLKNTILTKNSQILQLREVLEQNGTRTDQQFNNLKQQYGNLSEQYSKLNNFVKQKLAQLQELSLLCQQKDAEIQKEKANSIYLENTINRLSAQCNKKDDLLLKMEKNSEQIKIVAYEQSINEINKEKNILEAQIYKRVQNQISLHQQIKNYQNMIISKDFQNNQIKNTIYQLNQKTEMLKQELRIAQAKYFQLLKENEARRQQFRQKYAYVEESTESLARYQTLFAQKQEKLLNTENILRERQAELQILKSQTVNLQQVSKYQLILDEHQKKIAYLQGILSEKDQQMNVIVEQGSSRQNHMLLQIDTLKEHSAQVFSSLQQSKTQCSNLKRQLQKVTFSLSQKQNNDQFKLQEMSLINSSLKGQLQVLNQQIQQLNRQLYTLSLKNQQVLLAFQAFRNQNSQQKSQNLRKMQDQQEEIKLKTNELQHLRGDMAELQQHITSTRQQNHQLEVYKNKIIAENSQLIERINYLQTNQQEHLSLLSQKEVVIQRLNQKLVQLVNQIQAKQQQFVERSTQKQTKLEEQLAQLRSKQSKRQEELTQSRAEQVQRHNTATQLQRTKELIQHLSAKLKTAQQQKYESLEKQQHLEKILLDTNQKIYKFQRQYQILLSQKQNNAEVTKNILIKETDGKLESMMKKLQIAQQEYEQNKQQLHQAHTKIHVLEQQSVQLKETNYKQAQAIQEFSELNQNYRNSVLQYTTRIKDYQSKIQGFDHLQSQNNTISFQLQASLRKNQQLLVSYQQLEVIKQQRTQKTISLESENQSLRLKVHELNLLQTKQEMSGQQLQGLRKQNSILQQKIGQKDLQLSQLLYQKYKQTQQYQESIAQLQSKLGQLQSSLVAIKEEKKNLQQRISNITSTNQINSLKLISKVKQEQQVKQEIQISRKKVICLQQILEDKTQQLENVYKLYQNLRQEIYATSYSCQLPQNSKVSQLQLELQKYNQELGKKQILIRENQELICIKANEINNLNSQLSQKTSELEQILALKEQFLRKESELLQNQQILHEDLDENSKMSCELKQKNIELEMKMEQLMLIEIEGYRYKLNMYQITIRNLKNEMEEKDRQIKSLRVQKDALYQAVQQSIKTRTSQSFGQTYDEFKFQTQVKQQNQSPMKQNKKSNQKQQVDFFIETKAHQISKPVEEVKTSKIQATQYIENDVVSGDLNSLTVQAAKSSKILQSQQRKEEIINKNNQQIPFIETQLNRNEQQQVVQDQQPHENQQQHENKTALPQQNNSQQEVKLEPKINQYSQQVKRSATTEKLIQKESLIYVEKEITENIVNNFSQEYFSSEGFSNQFEQKVEKVKIREYDLQYQASQIKKLGNKKESEYQDINQMRNQLRLAQNQHQSNTRNSEVQEYKYYLFQQKSSEKLVMMEQKILIQDEQQDFMKQQQRENKQKVESQQIKIDTNRQKQKMKVKLKSDDQKQIEGLEKQKSQKLGDSMLSMKSQKEGNVFYEQTHKEEVVNQLQQIISEEKIAPQGQNERKPEQGEQFGNDFQQFGELKSQKLGDSMISNKSQKQISLKPTLKSNFNSDLSPLLFSQPDQLFNHSQRTQIQTQLGQINQLLKFIPSPRALHLNQNQSQNNFNFLPQDQNMIRSSKKSVQSIDSNTQNIFQDFFAAEKVQASKPQEDLFDYLNFQTNSNPFSVQSIIQQKQEVKKQQIDQHSQQNYDLI